MPSVRLNRSLTIALGSLRSSTTRMLSRPFARPGRRRSGLAVPWSYASTRIGLKGLSVSRALPVTSWPISRSSRLLSTTLCGLGRDFSLAKLLVGTNRLVLQLN